MVSAPGWSGGVAAATCLRLIVGGVGELAGQGQDGADGHPYHRNGNGTPQLQSAFHGATFLFSLRM